MMSPEISVTLNAMGPLINPGSRDAASVSVIMLAEQLSELPRGESNEASAYCRGTTEALDADQ